MKEWKAGQEVLCKTIGDREREEPVWMEKQKKYKIIINLIQQTQVFAYIVIVLEL